MSETPPSETEVEKQDSLEESLSSEEWTFIDKKDPKSSDGSETSKDDKKVDEPKETVVSEDDCKPKENIKAEVENVEEGEEAGEKDAESDDVSIISDESEPEHVIFEEGRVQRLEWQVERKSSNQLEAVPCKEPTSTNDPGITSNALITCSVVALILGVILAGKIVEFQGDKPSFSVNTQIQEKLRELNNIEKKLEELKDVKQALDQIRVNIPDMKEIKDQFMYQKEEKNKLKYSVKDYEQLLEIQQKLNRQNFNPYAYDDRLEMLEATYQNFCSTINKINSSSTIVDYDLCKTPKVLTEMIIFKKNLKRAFEKTQVAITPEKRFFIDAERKLDAVSESLLSELSMTFSKFSMKVQERFNKFSQKLNKRLCLMHVNGRENDEFYKTLHDAEYYENNCNKTIELEPVVIDSKSNATWKNNKPHDMKKRSYEELKKNGFKYDNKSKKEFKKINGFNENSSAEENSAKSKGEVKNDKWQKNKNENKEKYSSEEKNYNKYQRFADGNENDDEDEIQLKNRKNNFENSSDNIKKERDFDQTYKYTKKEHNNREKSEYVDREKELEDDFEDHRKYESDRQYERKKKEYNSDRKYDNGRKNHESSNEYENIKKEYNADRKYEKNRKNYEFNGDYERKKKDYHSEHKYENDRKPYEPTGDAEYKKKDESDRRRESGRKNYEFNNESEHNKREEDLDRKYENGKRNREYDSKYERKKDQNFDRKVDNRKNYIYDYDDTKFIIKMDSDDDRFAKENDKLKEKYDKEYYFKSSENGKEYKQAKYQGSNERRDKKDKFQSNGEWQMQRSVAREKLRNSDWYFVRADSRKKARILLDNLEENEEEEEMEDLHPRTMKERQNYNRPPQPPPQSHYHNINNNKNNKNNYNNNNNNYNNKNYNNKENVKRGEYSKSFSRGQDDSNSFRRRVMRKVGRTWEFLNDKFHDYF